MPEITQQQLDQLHVYYYFYFAENGRILPEGYLVQHPTPMIEVPKVAITPLAAIQNGPPTVPMWPDDGLLAVTFHLYCIPIPWTINPAWARGYAEQQYKQIPQANREAYRVVLRSDIAPAGP